MTDAERLTRLEERYAHLQKHVVAQDKAMLELTDEVTRLRKELAVLRGQIQPTPGSDETAGEDRPPHY
jgi:SlyX protein